MALEPKITVCPTSNCDKLKITDTTGVHSSANTGGWESPNISGSDVDTAEIIITYPDGSEKTFDVLDQIPDTVSGEFSFTPLEGSWDDGKYTIKYKIVDPDNSVNKIYKIEPILLCHTRCCVQKMIADIPDELCDCEHESFVEDANLANGLLRGVKEAYRCSDTERAEGILKKIRRLCDFDNCNC